MVSTAVYRRVLALLLTGTLLLFALALQVAPARAAAQGKLRPFVVNHKDLGGLQFPPDTNYCVQNLNRLCYQPAQLQKAYNLAPLYAQGYDGRGRTIVIVDSFGSPTIQNDLHVFDQTFHLPDPPSLKVISPAGAPPPFDPTNSDMVGWAQETTLDVEWSHVMAPGANILMVTTPVSETEGVQGFPEIVFSENYVIDHNLGDVISQSFGATEATFPDRQSILNLRSAFVNALFHRVTVLGSSGDEGSTDLLPDTSCCYPTQVNSWPSSDPLVTSIGGTQLHLDEQGNRVAPDNAWDDPSSEFFPGDPTTYAATGGGPSHVFKRPLFQIGVKNVVGGARGTPDISMSGACNGAVDYYYTFANTARGPWHLVCGTSESSPLFAGIVAIADQVAGKRLGWLNPQLYLLGHLHTFGLGGAGIQDVTIGDNHNTFADANNNLITVPGFPATPGYDMASGWGSVDANRFCRELARLGGSSDRSSEASDAAALH
jgi:subtilase family serine protease